MRYTVTESKAWRHRPTGATASVYGACPWGMDASRSGEWEMVSVGWTVRNDSTGTVGIGRRPWATREAAQAWVDAAPGPDRVALLPS